MTASGSSHNGSTTYSATASFGSVTPSSNISAFSLQGTGSAFTVDDGVNSITFTPDGVCNATTASATWTPVSPSPSASPPSSSPAAPSATPPSSSPAPGSSPTVTPSITPSNSVVWYGFTGSVVVGDNYSACDTPNNVIYYNTTASYATGLMNVYLSKNFSDPATGSGWIRTGSFAKSIGGGVLASASSSCAAFTQTLTKFYRSAGKTTPAGLCSASYLINDPTYAYLDSSWSITDLSGRVVYDSTGSAGNTNPNNFVKVSETTASILSGGYLYYAVAKVNTGETQDGNTYNTIEIYSGSNSQATFSNQIDCGLSGSNTGSGGGLGDIP